MTTANLTRKVTFLCVETLHFCRFNYYYFFYFMLRRHVLMIWLDSGKKNKQKNNPITWVNFGKYVLQNHIKVKSATFFPLHCLFRLHFLFLFCTILSKCSVKVEVKVSFKKSIGVPQMNCQSESQTAITGLLAFLPVTPPPSPFTSGY